MRQMSRPIAWALILVAYCCSGVAQTVTGSLRGVVTDPSGSIVTSATVTATNTSTGVPSVAKTNGAGEYSLRFLQVGSYKLTIEASGFNTANYGPVSLEIDQTAKIDIKLTVGDASTTVNVSDQVQPILNTESATLGETFTENTINSVPLNGRDFSQLTVYTPGAVSTGFNQYGTSNSTERSTSASNEVSVNGNRQASNNFLLDGQEVNENLNNTIGYSPSPDSIGEIRVIASNANAEFGNVNGGTVLMVMKSGTNQFHGSVFAFLENYNLNANTWANDNNVVAVPKNPYTQTIFGGTIGGPIIKDKLFFFVNYEGLRYHKGGETTASQAPLAFLNGDFSALLNLNPAIQLYDTTTLGTNGLPVPYLRNQVPVNNPVAAFLAAHPNAYPAPNNPTSDPLGIFNNFIGPSGSFNTNDQGDVKIDWHVRANDSVMGRYSQGYAADGTTADPVPVQFPSGSTYPDHFVDMNWVHTFNSAIVNQFTANYGRIRFNSGVTVDPSGIFGLNGNKLVGIPSTTQQAAGFSLQSFNGIEGAAPSPGNFYPASFGANPTPEIFIDNIFGYTDNLTWQRGRHLFKFGGQFLRYQQNSFYPGNDGELGNFSYTGNFTAGPGATTLYPFADFVADRVYDVQIGAVTGRTGQRQWRDSVFAQDDFKVNSNFTLNLGLRWEFDQPIFEVNNKMANIDMQTKQIIYAGVNGASRALYDPSYTQFQPRIGFAYQPSPRTVVRGGYGISSYLEGTGANLRLTQNPPFHTDFEQTATLPTGAAGNYNGGAFYQASAGFPTTQVPTTTFYVWPKDLKPSVVQEFSVTTEYEVSKTSSFQFGYVGILGHHLTDPYWGNQLPAPGAPAPYGNIVGQNGVIKVTQTESASNYNALQAIFRQHPMAGLELTANYTYSKSLTDDIGFYGTSNIGSNEYYQQNAYDLAAEWGPAGSDTRHNLSVTGVYELPFGHGKRFGANSNYVVNEALGGWKLSGSEVYYSGFPVTVSSPANYSNSVFAYSGAARPDQLRPLNITNRSSKAYYGTAVQGSACASDTDNGSCVFAAQSANHFGNVRPSSLPGPPFQNIDMSVEKSFPIWRENRVNFRGDFFNTFNIASYAQPDNGVTDANFGQITSVNSSPRTIQLSLKYQF